MSKFNFLASSISFFVPSIGRTQSPNIIPAYGHHFMNAPLAYISYTCLAIYFGYRFVEAYLDKSERMRNNQRRHNSYFPMYEGVIKEGEENENQEELATTHRNDSLDTEEKAKIRFDNIVMGTSALAVMLAANWSFAPFCFTPQLVTMASCAIAEAAVYYGPSHEEVRNGGDDKKSFCKFISTVPIVDSFLKVTGLAQYSEPQSRFNGL